MPRAGRQTISIPEPTVPYPPPTESSAEDTASNEPRYHTRRVGLKFSHTKTPFIPPPLPPKDQPPVPKSVARKGSKSTQSTTAVGEQTHEDTPSFATPNQTQQVEPEAVLERNPNQAVPTAPNPNPPSADTPDIVGASVESPSLEPPLQENNVSHLPPIPENIGIEPTNSVWTVDTALVPHSSQAVTNTLLSNPFATPGRINRPAGFATPTTMVLIQNSHDRPEHQFHSFIPNPFIPLDPSLLSITLSPCPSPRQNYNQQSGFGSWTPRQNEFAPPESGSGLSGTSNRTTAGQDVFGVTQATLTAIPTLTVPRMDVNSLYTTIVNTLPTFLPATPLASTLIHSFAHSISPGLAGYSASGSSAHSDVVSHNELVLAQPHLASHANPATPDTVHGSQIVQRSSSTSSSAQLPNVRLPSVPTTTPSAAAYRPNLLRQNQFQYDEVVFSNYMKYCWILYLATEDPFPTNVFPAREACISYAEEALKTPRGQYPLAQLFDFVRKKDSNIRNSYLTGLLQIVEQAYNVNNKTPSERLNDLINNLNFAHASFDLVAKRLTGRYRHPCVFQVVKSVLFPKRARGKPIGVRFIRQIMGNPMPGADPRNIEAPIATIALACTLILHAFHSIKGGDSSSCSPNSKKPVQWSESRYGDNYRRILSKMKKYDQIGEVQKDCMVEIMKEYVAASGSTGGSDEDDVQFDDEMLSDGENDI
ncbi:hypothetical protein RhiLY_14416 [Ceratobasidium sp. AG-Ba]|nr:hypothetical protein RhiLY_14416 [Ceratobasidium sp. AG-Ba]